MLTAIGSDTGPHALRARLADPSCLSRTLFRSAVQSQEVTEQDINRSPARSHLDASVPGSVKSGAGHRSRGRPSSPSWTVHSSASSHAWLDRLVAIDHRQPDHAAQRDREAEPRAPARCRCRRCRGRSPRQPSPSAGCPVPQARRAADRISAGQPDQVARSDASSRAIPVTAARRSMSASWAAAWLLGASATRRDQAVDQSAAVTPARRQLRLEAHGAVEVGALRQSAATRTAAAADAGQIPARGHCAPRRAPPTMTGSATATGPSAAIRAVKRRSTALSVARSYSTQADVSARITQHHEAGHRPGAPR